MAVNIPVGAQLGYERVASWYEQSTWSGEGMRREVFFFPCEGVELYGSLYAAESADGGVGVAICNSWGIEADQANRLVHLLALSVARAGGAGLVFHYPGHGDSRGRPQALTMEAMATAAEAAFREGERRQPERRWMLAGFMLGASVAALTLERIDPSALLLGQPALRPSAYFDDVERRARRIAAITRSGDETLFGYSLPTGLRDSAAAADERVSANLDAFAGCGAVVRYSSPDKGTDEVPNGFELVEAKGTWRFAAPDDRKLERAAGEWLAGKAHEDEGAQALA